MTPNVNEFGITSTYRLHACNIAHPSHKFKKLIKLKLQNWRYVHINMPKDVDYGVEFSMAVLHLDEFSYELCLYNTNLRNLPT